jgi:hypothetical protein
VNNIALFARERCPVTQLTKLQDDRHVKKLANALCLAATLIACETPLRSAAATAQVAPRSPNTIFGHYWCFSRAPGGDPVQNASPFALQQSPPGDPSTQSFRGTLVRMKMTRRPDGPQAASISLSFARCSASSRTAIRIGAPLGVCRSVSSSMRDVMRLMVFRVAIAHAFPSYAFQLV